MFIIQNGKITSDKTLDIGKLRIINLVFESDYQFADDDKFKLVLGDIQSENFGFTNGGYIGFSYINLAEIIKKENTDLAVKVTCNGSQIVSDSITITAYVQGGGGGEEIQGVVYNAFPINQSTQVKFIPSDFTKDITSFRQAFYGYESLTSISPLDTSNGTDFYQMFYRCIKLTSIPPLDTSNGTDFNNMFVQCESLTSIPPLDTSNGTNFNAMFNGCKSLQTVPQLNAINATTIGNYIFFNCFRLENFGGLLNAKISYSLSSAHLTHQSLMNVLNGLYDLTGSTSQTLTLGPSHLAKLTDEEKAIATNKNWVLA